MSAYHYPSDREMRELRKLIPEKIPFTPMQIALEIAAGLIFAAVALYLWRIWPDLPERIPTHYGLNGQADGWGGKGTVLLLPIVGVLIYTMCTVLLFFPTIWNVPYRFDADSVVWTYQQMRSMMAWTNLAMAVIFGYLTFQSAQASLSLSPYFFIVLMLAIFLPVIYYWRRLKKRLMR